jgi:hypothetical protein
MGPTKRKKVGPFVFLDTIEVVAPRVAHPPKAVIDVANVSPAPRTIPTGMPPSTSWTPREH